MKKVILFYNPNSGSGVFKTNLDTIIERYQKAGYVVVPIRAAHGTMISEYLAGLDKSTYKDEYRQILAEFTRIAIPKPGLEFKFIHNSRQIFHLGAASNVKQRLLQIEGKSIAKDLIGINAETNIVSISGFVGRPELAKKVQNNQYFFVNGRFFKSPMLHKSVIKAYANLIPQGYTPSYFIFLEIEPSNMDVNIHPTKTEIKFEDDSVIFEILMATVKEAIGGNALAPAIDFDMEGAPEIPATPLERTNIRQPKINFDPLFNPFRDLDSSGMHAQPREEGRRNGYDLTGEGKLLFEEGHETERREIMQIQGRYLLTSAKSGVMLIDAMRAKERILYERYLNALRGARPAIQENLFPQTVELDSASFAIFTQVQEKIRELGFDIRPFGKNCVIVSGIPAAFANEQIDVAESVETMIAGFETHDTQERSLADYRERIALGMVKNIKSNKKSMTHDEAVSIVESIFACKESSYSPSGLPIMKTITVEELSAMLKN